MIMSSVKSLAVTLAAIAAITAATLAGIGGAVADDWPSKPIKVIIPFGAGSATDVVPRIALEQLQAQLGQPIVIENRPGAGSATGTAAVAKAEPDGYTLLITSSAFTVSPAMYASLPYDPVKDLAAVIPVGGSPSVLIVPTDRGFKTAADMVAAAKAKPGSFNFATVGAGSAVHMAAEKFRLAAGYEAAHVPFKSGAEALTEIIAGRIDYYLCPIGTALPMIKDGKVTALAISSPKRASALPELPTTVEAGFKDSTYDVWLGMLAPAKTPKPILDKLYAEMAKALAMPAVRQKYAQMGIEPLPLTSAEFATQISREIAGNAALVKAININPK